MAAQKTPTASAPKVPKLLASKPKRTPPFTLIASAPRVDVCDQTGEPTGAVVTRGKRSNDASDKAQEYLVLKNGDKMTGIALDVIGYALLGGAIPRDQVEEVLALQ